MRSLPPHHEDEQLDLFHPACRGPTWWTLPSQVRERTIPLLARMVGEYLIRHLGADAAREVGDER